MASIPVQITPSTNDYLKALQWEGWRWSDGPSAGTTITYYFGASGQDLASTFGTDETPAASLNWVAYQRTAYQQALHTWENVANITFTQVSNYSQADLVEYIYDNPSTTTLGIHETPEGAYYNGINYNDETAWGAYNISGAGFTQSGLQAGGYGFTTLVHEIGHALGLAHPHDGGGDGVGLFPGVDSSGDSGDHGLNQGMFTVMSYIDGWTGLGSSPSYDYGWQAAPMAFDIAAIQHLYGPNTSYHIGNDTYTLGQSNTKLGCIWDADGVDTIAYSGTYGCTIDLRAATLTNEVGGGGFVSYVNGAPTSSLDHWSAWTIANGVVIEKAATGSGDDIVHLSADDVDNTVDGGGGANDVVYVPYSISGGYFYIERGSTADHVVIVGAAGTDTLDNVEYIHFEPGGSLYPNGATLTTEELTRVYTHQSAGSVAIDDVTVTEGNSGNKLVIFTVTRTGGTASFDVNFASANKTATVADGDFAAASGTLHFGDNVNTQTISVTINGDAKLESNEIFYVNLSGATNGATIGNSQGTGAIVNDDAAQSPTFTNDGDTASGKFSDMKFFALAGNDTINIAGNANMLFGDAGNDLIHAQGDQNQLFGGEGSDWIGVTGDNNALVGGAGDEVWMGASGNSNTLAGSEGQDSLYANGINNWLFGEANNDWLGCSGSQNQLLGGAGNEWMGATGSANALAGGEGDDTLFSNGANVLFGEAGNDWLGCSGNGNYMAAGAGNDFVAATGNANLLDGGFGNDTLLAAAGHQGDTFVFHKGYGKDEISGFARHGAGGSDAIDMKGFGLAFGALQGLMADTAGGVVITVDAATVLTIHDVTKAQLQASDFLLA